MKVFFKATMDPRSQNNGLQTFLEHWGFLVVVVVAFFSSQVLTFFTRLSGTPWIWCYYVGLIIAAVGVALVFYAKLPLYRQRRFFTFGSRALPESRRSFYRWGYRCVTFIVALLLCLFLSRP
jgi:hypothetical protein